MRLLQECCLILGTLTSRYLLILVSLILILVHYYVVFLRKGQQYELGVERLNLLFYKGRPVPRKEL